MSKKKSLFTTDFNKTITFYKKSKIEFERLEFLGDRVLGLSIAKYLFKEFIEYDEGKLAKIYSYLTSRKVLVKVGKNLKLDSFLKENNIENLSDRILSDFLEAVIGLYFLNNNYNKTYDVVVSLWNEEIVSGYNLNLDHKTNLQEWSQKKKLGLPIYTLVEKKGPDHKPTFKVKVEIKNYISAVGSGYTLQLAEQNAAELFISSNIP